MTPALDIALDWLCLSPSVGISRPIRAAKASARLTLTVFARRVQHRDDLAGPRKRSHSARYSKAAPPFLMSVEGRRQRSEQEHASTRPSSPFANGFRLLWRERTNYQSGLGTIEFFVQIPGLDTGKDSGSARSSRVSQARIRLVYPDSGERLRAIDAGKEVIPPEYRIEVYKHRPKEMKNPTEERLAGPKRKRIWRRSSFRIERYYGNEVGRCS